MGKYLPILNLLVLLIFPVDTFLLSTHDKKDKFDYLSIEDIPKSSKKNYSMNTTSGEDMYLGSDVDYIFESGQEITIEKTGLLKCPVRLRFKYYNEDVTWNIGVLNGKLNTIVFYFITITLCLLWIFVTFKKLDERRFLAMYFAPIGTLAFVYFYFT